MLLLNFQDIAAHPALDKALPLVLGAVCEKWQSARLSQNALATRCPQLGGTISKALVRLHSSVAETGSVYTAERDLRCALYHCKMVPNNGTPSSIVYGASDG